MTPEESRKNLIKLNQFDDEDDAKEKDLLYKDALAFQRLCSLQERTQGMTFDINSCYRYFQECGGNVMRCYTVRVQLTKTDLDKPIHERKIQFTASSLYFECAVNEVIRITENLNG